MKKKHWLLYVFSVVSTVLLTINIFVSSVLAISINNSESVISSSSSESSESMISSSSSESSESVISSSSPESSNTTIMPRANDDSNTSGYMGKYQVTTESAYNPDTSPNNGLVDHFSVNDDIGKCYCYDWQLSAPDRPGQEYNGYEYWQQMNTTAGQKKLKKLLLH